MLFSLPCGLAGAMINIDKLCCMNCKVGARLGVSIVLG